jgi:hypothetical protein
MQTPDMIQLGNRFLAAAVATGIVKSLKNVGISLRRIGPQIRC